MGPIIRVAMSRGMPQGKRLLGELKPAKTSTIAFRAKSQKRNSTDEFLL